MYFKTNEEEECFWRTVDLCMLAAAIVLFVAMSMFC